MKSERCLVKSQIRVTLSFSFGPGKHWTIGVGLVMWCLGKHWTTWGGFGDVVFRQALDHMGVFGGL